MGFPSETIEEALAHAPSEPDDFDLEAFLAHLDKAGANAEDGLPPVKKSAVVAPERPVSIKEMVASFEIAIERCVQQLAIVRPLFADIRSEIDGLERTPFGLEKQIQDQAKKLEAAARVERTLRQEVELLVDELEKTRELQAVAAEQLKQAIEVCRNENAARKAAVGACDEMEMRLKRHQAGEASALRRVEELSNLNEELEMLLRLPAANPRPVPQPLSASDFILANDGRLRRRAG